MTITNADRADTAQAALDAFGALAFYPAAQEPIETRIKDLLTNLMHLARREAKVADLKAYVLAALAAHDAEVADDDEGDYFCAGCGRVEETCSDDPCEDVEAERAESAFSDLCESEPPLSAAVAKANLWVAHATPCIKAYFAMDDIDGDLRAHGSASRHVANLRWNEPKTYPERTVDEARVLLRKPMREMREMADGIRDDFLCDEMWTWKQEATADDEDAGIAFNDALKASVISVDAAEKEIGDAL